MGASSSHHSPERLDRNRNGSSFKRSASLRQSKSRGGNKSSPRRMDRLRRSFRDSFRRRKDTTLSEASKPHLWQNDEMDVRSGTCSFHVKYLGCVEVFESRGMQVCEEALKVLKNSRRRPVKAILYVSGDGLRVVEDDTKGLIVDQTIEKVSFCAPDKNFDRGFSYICRDGTTRRWMCHGFLACKESGERLSHAVGCAFAVCLERKQRRDRECSVTMNFDMQNSTFTRTGSFRQQTLTDRLQDTTNVNNNVNVNNISVTTPSNNTTTMATIPADAVININNSNDYNRKENIPIRTTPKVHTNAIERPHATISMLQRQGSFRGLSHLNGQASPFKRQLSLRISDLPSNVERTRSHSLDQYSLDPRTPTSQFIHLKTPVSPIPEVSPTHMNDLSLNSATVTDQVSAMCQQLSQGLSLLTKNDDLLTSKTSELSSNQLLARDLFANKVNDFSQLIELKNMTSSSSAFMQKSCPGSENSLNQLLCQPSQQQQQQQQQSNSSDVLELMDTNTLNNNNTTATTTSANAVSNNNNNNNNNNTFKDEISNSSTTSQPMSTVSSVEIPLTPPATPPLPNNAQLPKPEQWLGKVAQLTMNVSDSSSSSSSPPAIKRIPNLAMHTRAYSLSSAETVLSRSAAASSVSSNDKADPFNIDWAALAIETRPMMATAASTTTTSASAVAPAKSTNPFLTGSPLAGSSSTADGVKTSFEIQM